MWTVSEKCPITMMPLVLPRWLSPQSCVSHLLVLFLTVRRCLLICQASVLSNQTNDGLNIFSHAALTPNVDTLLVPNYTYDEIQDLLSSILFHTFCCCFIVLVFFPPMGISAIHFVPLFLCLATHRSLSLSLSICLWFFF